jgi:hypothetical protein
MNTEYRVPGRYMWKPYITCIIESESRTVLNS